MNENGLFADYSSFGVLTGATSAKMWRTANALRIQRINVIYTHNLCVRVCCSQFSICLFDSPANMSLPFYRRIDLVCTRNSVRDRVSLFVRL